jgi:molybdopterin converting factor small subunit
MPLVEVRLFATLRERAGRSLIASAIHGPARSSSSRA